MKIRVVSRGRRDRQTDMTKLVVTLRNFANAPKNYYELSNIPSDLFNKITNTVQEHIKHIKKYCTYVLRPVSATFDHLQGEHYINAGTY
jgi:hypothetical protein